MNADDITVGMELEARETTEPGSPWLPATVRRRVAAGATDLDADACGFVRGLFEVQMSRPDKRPDLVAHRWAGELRPEPDLDPLGFFELPPGLHERAWRAACRAEADPLAGARARTDDNLRRAFGG